MVLPTAAVMATSGSSMASRPMMRPRKPLNTLSTHTSAIVATTMPHTDTTEIMFTALCAFFDIKYRRAIFSGSDMVAMRCEG